MVLFPTCPPTGHSDGTLGLGLAGDVSTEAEGWDEGGLVGGVMLASGEVEGVLELTHACESSSGLLNGQFDSSDLGLQSLTFPSDAHAGQH